MVPDRFPKRTKETDLEPDSEIRILWTLVTCMDLMSYIDLIHFMKFLGIHESMMAGACENVGNSQHPWNCGNHNIRTKSPKFVCPIGALLELYREQIRRCVSFFG